jgi:von Willebrand factor type A domain
VLSIGNSIAIFYKSVLKESMSAAEKDFVIGKAATAGQITFASAVFGRGTDFFCKDSEVHARGGVHVVQTFLSEQESEELQIKGRTARQGKKGSYSMVLLEQDLEDRFGLPQGSADSRPRKEHYTMLTEARQKFHDSRCKVIASNLAIASEKDRATHKYFDRLLQGDQQGALERFRELYLSMKERKVPSTIDIDLAFAIDNTGSMAPYSEAIKSIASCLIQGNNSLQARLTISFPGTVFRIRFLVLGYRDFEDGEMQFLHYWTKEGASHFTEDTISVVSAVHELTACPAGGGDIAEDHLGAIHYLTSLDCCVDWKSKIKSIVLLTDAPAHGPVPLWTDRSYDKYGSRHPLGLTVDSVASELIKKEIDLFICSFNPAASSNFEEEISAAYLESEGNMDEREIATISLMPKDHVPHGCRAPPLDVNSRHIVFVLDESGSMKHEWRGVVAAYNKYLCVRREQQRDSDLVSVVQFDWTARITVHKQGIIDAPGNLGYKGNGTRFTPAAIAAHGVVAETPSTHVPLVVFMSDGEADDTAAAAATLALLNEHVLTHYGDEIELHVIGFRDGTDSSQLQTIASASRKSLVYSASDVADLSAVFAQIAGGGAKQIASALEAEIGMRIYDAVTDRLAAEYSR